VQNESNVLRYGPTEGFCEGGNEHFICQNRGKRKKKVCSVAVNNLINII
jgi:hypothetical protein